MPRRQYRRKKNFRKKSASSRYGGYLSTASKALAVAYGVKKLINVERKFLVTTGSLNPVGATPTISCLSLIPQGDTASSRDGNKCKCISLHMQSTIFINSSAATTAVRVMLVCDKNSQGAFPAITDILQSNSYLSSYNNVNCPYRFRIIMDKRVTLSDNGKELQNLDRYIKQQKHMTFQGTGSTIADTADGVYYIVTLTNESVNSPTIVFNNRLTFVDN